MADMSTTHLAEAIATIYISILNEDGLTVDFAAKVIGRVAERVELMFDALEREDFVARVAQLIDVEGYVIDVAAHKAAREIVPDYLVEAAAAKGGGWAALYGPDVDADAPIIDGHPRPDYKAATAGDLEVGDGLRLIEFFHAYTGTDLDQPLTVTKISGHPASPQIIAVSVIDRASMVHEAMGNLPDGVAETVATLIFGVTDAVLLRR